jgi:hypothetical protein
LLKTAGMNIVFFKRPKPRQFHYTPMYYDPAKEEAEERKKLLNSLQSDDPRERMRAQIRRKWKTEQKETDKRSQFFRIFLYMIFAGFIIYIIFFTDFINKLVSLFLR